MSTLSVTGLDTGYEDFQALFGVSVELAAGERGWCWSRRGGGCSAA